MAQPPKSEDTSSDEINESSPTSSTPAPADESAAPEPAPEASTTSVDAAASDDSGPSDDGSTETETETEAPEAVAALPAPIEDAVHPDAPDASTLPSSFVEMGLPEPMLAALEKLGWGAPTKVQAAAFGPASAGKDVLVQSQTGSGKTGAFCLPWLAGRFEDKDPKETGVQLIVMTPTRELAKQVCDQLVGLAGETPLTPLPVYGGTPIGPQFDALKSGVHAVVGTPGRILDHIRRRTLDLSKVRTAILDEADEMLSMGFLEDIHSILDACQKDRQTMLFSATVPSDIERIARRYMKDPESLKLSGDDIAASLIDHTYYSVPGSMRTRDLMNFIAQEEPGSTLIFCNTREETNLVANVLRKEGFSAEAISSDLSQAAREHVLGAMRKGRLRFLVATDVASRGIDITHISHVVNYSFPQNAESYVHRTGRTGRAGRAGKAVSLIGPQDMGNFYYLKLAYPSIDFTESKLPPAAELDAVRNQTKLDQISKRFPDLVSADWRLLVRTLSSDPRGEQVMAYLLSEAMSSPDPATQVARDLPEEEDDEYAGGRGRRPAGRRDSERGPRSRDRDRPRSRDAERPRNGERSRDGERSNGTGRDRDRDRGRRPRRDEDVATTSESSDDDTRRRTRTRRPERERHSAASDGVVVEAAGPDDTVELGAPAQVAPPVEASEPTNAATQVAAEEPEATGASEDTNASEDANASEATGAQASDTDGRGRRRRRGRRRGGRDGAPRDSTAQDGEAGEPREGRQDGESSPAQETGPTEPAPAPELAASANDPEGDTEVAAGEEGVQDESAELTAAPSEATEGLQQTDEGVSARGRRRRRRRRRGKGKSDEASTQEAAGAEGGEASSTDGSQPEGVSADSGSSQDEDANGKRRRRRRRGGRGKRPEAETGTATETKPVQQHVSQDQIIIDIDQTELAVVRDEFGEIDELDDLTLKGRRRGVIDALQDEVELEDMSEKDTPAPAAPSEDAEADETETDEDADGVAADGAEGDDPDDKEAKKRKRRRRRRKKKPAEEVVTPELTAPPHKDFWEVWSTKFTFREFEDDQFRGGTEAIVDEPDPEPESEPANSSGGEPRRKRRSRRGGGDRNRNDRGSDRNDAERSPRTVVNGSSAGRDPARIGAEDGPMVTVALNVGRTHGKKSAHVRELLASDFGLEGRSVRNLTVKETLTEFRVSTTAFESLKAAVLGYVFDDIELELTVIEAAELESVAAPEAEASSNETTVSADPADDAGETPPDPAAPDAALLATAPDEDTEPPQPEV